MNAIDVSGLRVEATGGGAEIVADVAFSVASGEVVGLVAEGLSNEEIAEYLGVSTRSVARDWLHAQAWLRRELIGEKPDKS